MGAFWQGISMFVGELEFWLSKSSPALVATWSRHPPPGTRFTLVWSVPRMRGSRFTGEDGWFDNVPLEVKWSDASGGWHEIGRPDCQPPAHLLLGPVALATTEVTVNGTTWRPVTWVS